MKILTLFSGHEASACILEDGVVKNYYKEERYSRQKHTERTDRIVKRVLLNYNDLDYGLMSTNLSQEQDKIVRRVICSINPSMQMIRSNDSQHHIFHASLSFYNSGFDKALCFVCDASGGIIQGHDEVYEGESIYIAEYPYSFKPILKNYWSANDKVRSIIKVKDGCTFNIHNVFGTYSGIGNLYNTAALVIGQTINDCGKAMGLSSYGSSNDMFANLYSKGVKDRLDKCFWDYPELIQVLNGRDDVAYHLDITKDNYKFFADYCYEVQIQSQDRVCKMVGDAIEKTGIKKVCVGGGFGMNIVTNYQLIKQFPDVEFYFEPLCDDGGNSIGAAMLIYRRLTKDSTVRPITTTSYHGEQHDVSKYVGETVDLKGIASLLYNNKSVAIFKGYAEAGQRALGNRSILFNALNPDARDIVNRIKKREWYRPFAAIVLEEDAHLYFDDVIPNPYMTVCFPVRTDLIPGVTHVDNTCRIQTVSTGHLYDLLLEFKRLSGHGILLNTSFNLAGEPLVETPEDALKTLSSSTLDHLWFYDTEQLL